MVTRPVVVLMGARKEEQDGHAFAGEVDMIGAVIEPFLRPDVVDGRHVELGVLAVHSIQRLT